MLGQFYGESDFDRANPEPSALEGSSDSELRDSKANLIRNLMSGESLAIDEACLVEDDPQEIASVQGTCRSVFVAERRGMTEGEMEELRRLAGVKVPHQASETAAAKVSASKASVAKPQTAPPPPPEGFGGICKAGGKSVPPKGPVPAAPPAGFNKAGSKEPSATVVAEPKSLAAGVQGESTQGRVKHIYFDACWLGAGHQPTTRPVRAWADTPTEDAEHGAVHLPGHRPGGPLCGWSSRGFLDGMRSGRTGASVA